MKQLLETTIYIHSTGIIHRDLKPENIMITLDNNQIKYTKIIDFGFAKFLYQNSEVKDIFGTPNYVGN